jgi:transcriptional pleiotropic regulator of transition state genes
MAAPSNAAALAAHAPHLLDDLGRVVIPVAIRRQLGWGPQTALVIRRDGSRVVIERWSGTCVFCGADSDAERNVLGQTVCASCRATLRQVLAAGGSAHG